MLNRKKIVLYGCVLLVCLMTIGLSQRYKMFDLSYDYRKEVSLKNSEKNKNALRSNEDTSVTFVKSSLFYNISTINLDYDKSLGVITNLESLNFNEKSPLYFDSIQSKNNGFFIILGFKDSGVVTDFRCEISVDDKQYSIEEAAIDCSNKVRIYVPHHLQNDSSKIRLSDFYWKSFSKVPSITTLNMDDGGVGMQDDENAEMQVQLNDSTYEVSYQHFNLRFKAGYNSLEIENKFSIYNKLSSFILGKRESMLLIFTLDDVQVGSTRIDLDEFKKDTIYVVCKFNRIKMVL